MKNIIIFMFFLTLTFTCSAMSEIEKKSKLISNSTPTTEIPQDVLLRFYNSFIIDDYGNFLGAKVDEVREYVTFPEIILLIADKGYEVSGLSIIDRHRPRRFGKGCKYSNNWICQFQDPLSPDE